MKNKTKGWLLIVISIILIIGILGGYFYYESTYLISNCSKVSSENLQECCDRWQEENNIVKPACVGYWKIKNNQCSWECEVG